VRGLLKGIKWLYRILASKEVALGLLALLCLVLVPRTFAETKNIRLGILPSIIFGVMALNLVLCTVQRLKTLSRPVLVMHLGTILVLAGGVISSFGYVATVNIYEGSTVNTAYRWDHERDMPLDFDVTVKKINLEYYPVPVKVGVLRGKEKHGLFELKTGESFMLDRYLVRAESMELRSENLLLSVHEQGRLIGSADTSGVRNLPADFPYDFKLVAYKNAHLKMAGVDLQVSKKDAILAAGRSQINSPLTWEDLSFYNTAFDADDYGMRYAGIQITKDPGRRYVYFGFAVVGAGSLLYLSRRLTARA